MQRNETGALQETQKPIPTDERSEWKTINLKPRGEHEEKSPEHHLGNGLFLAQVTKTKISNISYIKLYKLSAKQRKQQNKMVPHGFRKKTLKSMCQIRVYIQHL